MARGSTIGLYRLRATFKDPVHGLIPVNELEYRIIQHPIFLRLHGVKQLGFTYLVYPQAKHTRFEHSLGSMHIAHTMALSFMENSRSIVKELLKKNAENNYDAFVQLARLQALMHDLGHLPYSHATERVIEKEYERGSLPKAVSHEVEKARSAGLKLHEYITCALIEKLSKDLGLSRFPLAREVMSGVKESLCGKSDGRWRRTFTDLAISVARAMISGRVTDVDRMDYLLRDAHNTGATYGHYDVMRLATGLSVKYYRGRIRITAPVKLLSNLEELYYSRYMMYKWVYLHHKVGALELTYEETLRRLADEWGRVKRRLTGILPNPPSSFWDMFTSSSIWRYATRYGQSVDDSLMDTIIRIARNTGSGELQRWAQGLVERAPPLRSLFKRQESLLLKLASAGGGKADIEEGMDLLRKLTELARHTEGGLDGLADLLEDYINRSLEAHGLRVRVFINPPISAGGAGEPLIDVDGVLHPIERVSVFIDSIRKMGAVPIIYVYYIGTPEEDRSGLADKVALLLKRFIEERRSVDHKGLH